MGVFVCSDNRVLYCLWSHKEKNSRYTWYPSETELIIHSHVELCSSHLNFLSIYFWWFECHSEVLMTLRYSRKPHLHFYSLFIPLYGSYDEETSSSSVMSGVSSKSFRLTGSCSESSSWTCSYGSVSWALFDLGRW